MNTKEYEILLIGSEKKVNMSYNNQINKLSEQKKHEKIKGRLRKIKMQTC